MATQLHQFVKDSGPEINLGRRKFTVEGISSEDKELAAATFKSVRASYTGVLCPKARVAGRPGAEVWSVIGPGRELARFAVYQGEILPLG